MDIVIRDKREAMAEVIKLANALEGAHAHKIFMQSLLDCEEALEADGWTKGEFDHNGFQWDFWLPFTKGDKQIMLCGSGYYNNHITLRIA